MKKLIILTAALMMLMSISAFATETRVMTMGETNMVLLDDANIMMFPSRINEYPNLAIGEFSGGDFNKFGVHWKFGDDNPWILGVYVNTAAPSYPNNLMGGSLVPWDFGTMQNHRLDMYYGRKLGNNNFGMRMYFDQSSTTVDAVGDQRTESFNYWNLTFGFSDPGGSWDVAALVGAGGWTDEDANGAVETEKDGYLDFGVAARYFNAGPVYTWIPHVAVMFNDHGVKVPSGASNNFSGLSFEAGMGLNYTPANNVLTVADFGLGYGKVTGESKDPSGTVVSEVKYSSVVIPFWKVGLDADVFPWMDIRLGATSDWERLTQEFTSGGVTNTVKYNSAENETYLGFGFHWGRLHLDTYTDPQMFLDGFNFLSGAETDMNWQISAVYEMM